MKPMRPVYSATVWHAVCFGQWSLLVLQRHVANVWVLQGSTQASKCIALRVPAGFPSLIQLFCCLIRGVASSTPLLTRQRESFALRGCSTSMQILLTFTVLRQTDRGLISLRVKCLFGCATIIVALCAGCKVLNFRTGTSTDNRILRLAMDFSSAWHNMMHPEFFFQSVAAVTCRTSLRGSQG
ncbi:hypothetical protein BD289DRAFT_173271 [Coniella lustricola]|uniref:Uncharacterized protein n=1 Tax=Coniella lustricola TaxID=2025994 RepID=A0A2T2ZTS3_9PEZI|nr:hypothetical protein BD289DRAFT_173271 [Coniella lustricola]